jgi:uncharacterized RDD family membrane protein YckC
MPTTITILTPENVEVTYEVAGLATRMRGAALDTLLQVFALFTLWMILSMFLVAAGPTLSNWLIALGVLLTFVIFVGYYLFFESRWNGQTPGKRVTGTRVMKDAGFPIDFRSAVVRNLVRLFDLMPGTYGVGFIAAFFSPEYKRLGDYAAGTVVVRERPGVAPHLEVIPDLEGGPSNLPGPEDLHAIQHFLHRRSTLTAEHRSTYARRLALAYGRLLGYPLDQVAAGPEAFLQWLVGEALLRRGG